jgi:asparagine synthase (glutamine-hydrolysing)
VTIPSYLFLNQLGIEGFPTMLRGMFSFILYDKTDESYCVVRDHVGITPLYYGHGTDGGMMFASEMKAIAQDCKKFEQFPPGHYYSSKTGAFHKWYNPNWAADMIPTQPYDAAVLRAAFEKAVERRMMSDVPWVSIEVRLLRRLLPCPLILHLL